MNSVRHLLLVFSTLAFIGSGCPDKVGSCMTDFIIQNNSQDVIFAFHFYNDCNLPDETLYSDAIDKDAYTIGINASKKIGCFSEVDIDLTDSLCLYVFKVEDLTNQKWDTILINNLYTKMIFKKADMVGSELLVKYP